MAHVLEFIINGLSIGLPVVAILFRLLFLDRQGGMPHFYVNGGGVNGTLRKYAKCKTGAPADVGPLKH